MTLDHDPIMAPVVHDRNEGPRYRPRLLTARLGERREAKRIVRHARRMFGILSIAAFAGCRAGDGPERAGEVSTGPPASDTVAGGPLDTVHLTREADDLERRVMELRTHVATMRQISPRMAATVMDEHVSHVRALAERIQAQRAVLPVSDAELPELLGMTPAEYRGMIEEVRLAGAEALHLQNAEDAVIQEQLPQHLERLERIAAHLEEGARSLRR